MTRSWKVGPLIVVADGWPDRWLDYADESYAPAEEGCGGDVLRVRAVDGLEAGPPGCEHAPLSCARMPDGGFSIHGGPLRAALDERAFALRIARSSASPHILVGNALRVVVSLLLPLRYDGLMLHASSAVLDGSGVAFAGLSGVGKTTLALGLKQARFLSDDISLLRDLGTAPRLLPSPFFGAAGRRGADLDADLAAVALLSRDPRATRIEPLAPPAGSRALIRHVVCFTNEASVARLLLARVESLARRVPILTVARFLLDEADEVFRRTLASRGDSGGLFAGPRDRTGPK